MLKNIKIIICYKMNWPRIALFQIHCIEGMPRYFYIYPKFQGYVLPIHKTWKCHRKLYIYTCFVVATNKPRWYTLLFTLLPFWDVHNINTKKFLLFLVVKVLMSPTKCKHSFKEKEIRQLLLLSYDDCCIWPF